MQIMITSSNIWQRTKLALTAVLMSVFGVTGFVSAASITNTGPDSTNKISTTLRTDCTVRNNNDVNVNNSNHQTATTGDAKSAHNTTAGSATTGDATNANAVTVKANLDNSQAAEDCVCLSALPVDEAPPVADISNTGPDSTNVIKTESTTTTTVTNTNDVSVSNSNSQTANSGDATVADNTTGGSATTGDATNQNAAAIMVLITNAVPESFAAPASAFEALCEPTPTPTNGPSGPAAQTTGTTAPRPFGGRGGGGAFFGTTTRFVQRNSNPAPVVRTVSASVPAPVAPVVAPTGGRGGGAPTPVVAPVNSISNTGPDSTNKISDTTTNTTTVSNTNNVSATNTNCQTASSGDATVTGNTTVNGGGSGAADNANTTGVGAAVTN